MAAGTLDLAIEQGTTFSQQLIWKDGASALINLTGYTARMQVRATIAAPDPPLVTLTTENGGIALGGAAGTITLTISATATAGYSWVAGVYDLELISASAVVTRLVKGSITVDPEVTR